MSNLTTSRRRDRRPLDREILAVIEVFFAKYAEAATVDDVPSKPKLRHVQISDVFDTLPPRLQSMVSNRSQVLGTQLSDNGIRLKDYAVKAATLLVERFGLTEDVLKHIGFYSQHTYQQWLND